MKTILALRERLMAIVSSLRLVRLTPLFVVLAGMLSLTACVAPPRTVVVVPVTTVVQKTAVSGAPLFLAQADTVDPECHSVALPVPRLPQSPTHGAVHFSTRDVFPNLSPNNPQAATCNKVKVPAVVAEYTSVAGFVGSDFTAVEFIFPSGKDLIQKFSITVK